MRRHRVVGGTHRDAALPAGAIKVGVLGVLATATIAAPLAAAAAGIDTDAAQQGEALAQSAPAAVEAQPVPQSAPVAIPAADEAAAQTRAEDGASSRSGERTATSDVVAVEDAALEVEAPEPEPVATEEAGEDAGGTGAASGDGYIRPVGGPITSGYGGRVHPVLGYYKGHDGVDFGASCGTPVKAAKAGTVVAVEYNSSSGNRVKVDHGNGVVTGYYHLQSFNTSVGATVQQGDTVGYVGSTGRSTGCHLHFAKMDEAGSYSDPMSILP